MKKFIIALLILSSVSLAEAQNNQDELKELISKSFSYFPRIKELEQQSVINEERIELSRKNYLPTLAGNVSYNYINPIGQTSFPIGPGVSKEIQFQPHNNFNANVALNYTVYDFGRTKASIEKAKEELLASKGNLEYNRTQLAAQVANIYYGVIYLEKAISIQDSVLNTLEENRKVAESKVRHGEGLEVDLLNIKSQIDNEKNRKADLQNNLQKQYNLLVYSTGQEQKIQGTTFDFASENTTAGQALEKAIHDNYEFSVAQNRLAVSNADISLNRAQRLPTLNLVGNTGFKNGYQPALNEMRFNYMIGANLSIPIYAAGKTNQQIKIAKSSAVLNQMMVESLKNTYRRDIQQAITDINSNLERLANIESQITLAQATERMASSRFKNGIGTHLELTTAITNTQRAQLSKLQYQYQLCSSMIELSKLMGTKYW